MIRLTCTSCRNELIIDDAFAGGVCRCRFCGTIQTVPSSMKGNADQPAVPSPNTATNQNSKVLFENKARQGGDDLDQLSVAVAASSGLRNQIGSGLRSSPMPLPKRNLGMWVLLGVSGAIILTLLIIMLVMMINRIPAPTPTETPATPAPTPVASEPPARPAPIQQNPTPQQPADSFNANFCDHEINGQNIVYLIDNGQSAGKFLPVIREAVLASASSLGAGRRFQIAFWNPGAPTFPAGHTTVPATEANIAAARAAISKAVAAVKGGYDPGLAVQGAITAKADEIILLSCRGASIQDKAYKKMLKAWGNSSTVIDCYPMILFPADTDTGLLSQLAQQTSGRYATISIEQLRAAAANPSN